MQPQTRNAATIAQKITSGISCIVVSSVALTPLQAIIKRSAYQVLRTNSGSFVTLAAILRPSGRREMVDRDLTNRKAALFPEARRIAANIAKLPELFAGKTAIPKN